MHLPLTFVCNLVGKLLDGFKNTEKVLSIHMDSLPQRGRHRSGTSNSTTSVAVAVAAKVAKAGSFVR